MTSQQVKLPVVYLVDDDDGARESIGWMLRSRRLLSEGFSNAEMFEALIDSHPPQFGGPAAWPNRPSTLVLDLRMPGTNGLVLFDRLLKRGVVERVPVIFLTGYGDVSTAVSTVKRGAFDFLEKPFTAEGLIQKIDAALAASEAALGRLTRQQATSRLLQSLTEREREVVYHVLKGLNSRAISDQLAISFRTADGHRLRAYEKLGVGSATQLANFMRERGVEPSELLSNAAKQAP
ncbi:MAG TPA: response regulator [Rhizobacter sp.]|nr:response regulator [Rhizobacter sp.]